MKLNTRAQTAQSPNNNSPIVLVHGFLAAWITWACWRAIWLPTIFCRSICAITVFPGVREMTYAAMAQDLLDTLDANKKVTLIGHSMGGKAVMALTALARSALVIDVAPVDYDVRRHDEILPPSMRSPKPVSRRASRRLPSCVSILMKKASFSC
jgi:esterase